VVAYEAASRDIEEPGCHFQEVAGAMRETETGAIAVVGNGEIGGLLGKWAMRRSETGRLQGAMRD
jgi:hypothetical protein